MWIVKLVDNFGDIIDYVTVNNDYELKEAARNLALELDVGEKIVVE